MVMALRNSKLTSLGKLPNGRRQYRLLCALQALQMCSPGEPWQDIKPELVKQGDTWVSRGTPYRLEVTSQGGRRLYPDRGDLTKYLELPAVGFFRDLPKTVGARRVVASHAQYEVAFHLYNAKVGFELLLRSPALERLTLDIEAVGLDIGELLARGHMGHGCLVEQGRREPRRRQVSWSYKQGQLELGLDLSGLRFPLIFRNASWSGQPGASADDAGALYNGAAWEFYLDFGVQRTGCNSDTGVTKYGGGMRFSNVTIPAASVINAATLTLVASANLAAGDVNSKLRTELANDAAQFSDYTDYSGRSRSVASVAWNAIAAWTTDTSYESPDFATPVQEVIDQAGWASGQHLVVFWDDHDGLSTYASEVFRQGYDYDTLPASSPTLAITYTPPGQPADLRDQEVYGMRSWGGI